MAKILHRHKYYLHYLVEPKTGILFLIGAYTSVHDIPEVEGSVFQVFYSIGKIPEVTSFPFYKHGFTGLQYIRMRMAGIASVDDFLKKSAEDMALIVFQEDSSRNRKLIYQRREQLKKFA